MVVCSRYNDLQPIKMRGIFVLSYLLMTYFCETYGDSPEPGFRFASYYQDHMVLQRAPNSAVIWGYGDIGGHVTVTLELGTYLSPVVKGPEGFGIWRVELKPHTEGGPFNITAVQNVKGNVTGKIYLHDVLFGDVWVCSGQSNMAMSVQVIFNSSYELNQTQYYPDVRIFYVSTLTSETPFYDLKAINTPWSRPTRVNINSFSAVCWLYGRYLYDKLKVPIGLVHSSWGGTPVETWMSRRALKTCDLEKETNFIKPELFELDDGSPPPQNNTIVWNAMIHPLLNMTIKGAIWYQGEQNAYYQRNTYNCSFPAMIKDWRMSWYTATDGKTDPEFAFGFVQLSIRNEPNWFDDGFYSMIRWHQTADYGYAANPKMPKTFMAVAMDLPDKGIAYNSPHPRDKQDVAMRLMLGALHHVYGEDVISDGPFPESAFAVSLYELEVRYPETQEIVIREAHNFQVCCVPKVCQIAEPFSGRTWTNATVTHRDAHSLRLDTTKCMLGFNAVRYAWTLSPCDFKQCQVYNTDGLPAAPFYMKIH